MLFTQAELYPEESGHVWFQSFFCRWACLNATLNLDCLVAVLKGLFFLKVDSGGCLKLKLAQLLWVFSLFALKLTHTAKWVSFIFSTYVVWWKEMVFWNSHDSHSYCKRVNGGGKWNKLIGKKSRPIMTSNVITYSKEKMT